MKAMAETKLLLREGDRCQCGRLVRPWTPHRITVWGCWSFECWPHLRVAVAA